MKITTALILILPLAACASTTVPWSNPDVPKEQWSRDYAGCRRAADRDSGWRDDDSASGSSPFREYDRQQAQKRYSASLSSCMIDRGYVPASRTKE